MSTNPGSKCLCFWVAPRTLSGICALTSAILAKYNATISVFSTVSAFYNSKYRRDNRLRLLNENFFTSARTDCYCSVDHFGCFCSCIAGGWICACATWRSGVKVIVASWASLRADTVIRHPQCPAAHAAAAAAAEPRRWDAAQQRLASSLSPNHSRSASRRARRPSPLNASQVAAEFASVRRAPAVRPIFHWYDFRVFRCLLSDLTRRCAGAAGVARRSNELGDDVTPDGRRRALVPRTVVDKLGNQRRVELTSLRHHCTAPPWSPVSPACFSVSVSACLPLPRDLTRTCRSVAYSRDFARHAYDFRS